ncbi:Mut7-C RNAse domain-containing protein [Nocardiopsis sp. NRRL B-16309]|uniref:Mut7-C RNAse domain-containing protein n=1 Tax=Nocardiopsis sp. NRRL B-16309 TaxID=1519494 RepID=UPI0006B0126B|nr:Mut7-C RNAse domain-containing protein [Nocardiopsis sp. NRRL B-16309]KOX15754.1 hypothetical protein ADL05_14205 [Nocardiopsis sp. NRRL B-16309]
MDQVTLTLRFAPELRFFLLPRNRGDQVRVQHDATSTLGHVIESLGPPRTEIGRLRADGTEVTTAHRPTDGQTIEIDAPEQPQDTPFGHTRFLLDVHLGTLARRLRLLGVDTAYDNDRDDDALVEQANDERRILLTRDRGLLRRRGLLAGAHVHHTAPDRQLQEVLRRFDPPLAPFTRCPACNGLVEPATKQQVQSELRAGTRATYDTFAQCRSCERVYWPGAHHERLAQIVDRARARTA